MQRGSLTDGQWRLLHCALSTRHSSVPVGGSILPRALRWRASLAVRTKQLQHPARPELMPPLECHWQAPLPTCP
eukprot:4309507-Alexandrium_andersonii.AAC.1